MRYTTIIDIRDFPSIWKSQSCRQLYLYMTLAAGFEDYNRDEVRDSMRELAYKSGLTLSATRHALKQLARARLVVRRDKTWKVAKWLQSPTISPRELNKRMTKQQQQQAAVAREREERQLKQEAEREASKRNAVSHEEYLQMKNKKQQQQ